MPAYRQAQLARNSTRFRILTVVAVERRRKMRRNCSPTENRCCGAKIIPACSRPAIVHVRVKPMEIGNVERIEDTFMRRGEGQLFFVGAFLLDRRPKP
jgi:hypothetical protein